MEQLIFHLLGDHVFQSHWMATEKTKRSGVALLHANIYSLPFLMIGSPLAFLVILVTHFFMDRFRLARYVIFARNKLLGKWESMMTWEDCNGTGYPSDTPVWLAVWLMIICDNTIHLAINYAALRWL